MANGETGRLFVLSGPSGVGKTTVVRALRQAHPELWISVSVTTRPARRNEVDGVNYHFIDDATFDQLVSDGELLEWAVVHGRSKYGTPRGPVDRALARGRSVLLELDLQGARQVRAAGRAATYIFLAPPSWDEMVRRLVGRDTEAEDEQQQRLASAREELAASEEFDIALVNHDVEQVCKELVTLMVAPAD
jgi:guanylate kinase